MGGGPWGVSTHPPRLGGAASHTFLHWWEVIYFVTIVASGNSLKCKKISTTLCLAVSKPSIQSRPLTGWLSLFYASTTFPGTRPPLWCFNHDGLWTPRPRQRHGDWGDRRRASAGPAGTVTRLCLLATAGWGESALWKARAGLFWLLYPLHLRYSQDTFLLVLGCG